MTNFEVFTRRNRRPSEGPTVTLTKRGTLTLNRAAFEALGTPRAAQLLWDRDRQVFGLRPVQGVDDDSYPINKSNLMINAAAFTKWIGLKTRDYALRWEAAMEDNVLCVQLPGTPAGITSNRRRTA